MLKKTLKYFFVFFGSITILSYFLNLPEKGAAATQDQLATFKEFIPEDRDSTLMFIKVMLEDDAKSALNQEDSLFSRDYPITSTREIRTAYNNNEISANQTYKDKVIRVKSTALLIGEAIGSSAYITVSSGNNDSFSGVNLYFDKKDPTLPTINKGDTIDAICVGKGKVLTFPMLDNCVFTKNKIISIADVTLKNAEKAWSSNNYYPLSQIEYYFFVIARSFQGYVIENCSESGKKCLDNMRKILGDEKKLQIVKESGVFDIMKAQMQDLPPLPSSASSNERKSKALQMIEN
jgi:hypothetical protein